MPALLWKDWMPKVAADYLKQRVDEVISVTYLRINPVLALLLLLTAIAAALPLSVTRLIV